MSLYLKNIILEDHIRVYSYTLYMFSNLLINDNKWRTIILTDKYFYWYVKILDNCNILQ